MPDDVRSRVVREVLNANDPDDAALDAEWRPGGNGRDTTSHGVYSYECPCGYTGPKSLDDHLEDDHGPEDFDL